jgi:ApbE superfamily uncharacterized protein (UPF0280 family)
MAGQSRGADWTGLRRGQIPGNRWHFQHGPIDLVIGAEGEAHAVQAAIERGWTRFASVLTELVAELRLLRSPVQLAGSVTGPVARRMVEACLPHRERFITPMAAVAGAVADEMIQFFREDPRIRRAYVNNGGDLALHLRDGERYRIGLFADLGRVQRGERWRLDGDFELEAAMASRGVATSGWRGRSFSLGIADSVTVLAGHAAHADAAATLIANAVNVDDAAIVRRPACALKDDTDLGDRLVTVEVGTLAPGAVDAALDAGASIARRMLHAGLIHGAVLWLQGRHRTCLP